MNGGWRARTVVDAAEALQAGGGGVDDHAAGAARVLPDVVHGERGRVDRALEVHVEDDASGFLRVAVLVELDPAHVVRARAHACVGEHVVHAAVEGEGRLEDGDEVWPG